MGYDPRCFEKANAELSRRRGEAVAKAAALRERMERECPRVKEIEALMAASAGQVVQAILAHGDVEQVVERVKTENLALQVELSMLLREHGAETTDFEPVYTCSHCRDTGTVDGKRCSCLEALLREYSAEALSDLSPMELGSFDDLTLDWYSDEPDDRWDISPRQRMKTVLEYCRAYAADFDGQDNSLLLRGPTGTGKTCLSLAIAGEVSKRGYSVVYGPTQRLLHRMEKEHFGRAEGESEEVMLACDLLILDDLGTEFTGSFYTAALYHLINGRMLEGKPTIISTNLSEEELIERYGDAITSRIIGTYQLLVCAGEDIRRQKIRRDWE